MAGKRRYVADPSLNTPSAPQLSYQNQQEPQAEYFNPSGSGYNQAGQQQLYSQPQSQSQDQGPGQYGYPNANANGNHTPHPPVDPALNQYSTPAQPKQRIWADDLLPPPPPFVPSDQPNSNSNAGVSTDPSPGSYNAPLENHIPPPPHATGTSYSSNPNHPSNNPSNPHFTRPNSNLNSGAAGLRPRIDPAQVPSPIEAQELDQNLYDGEDFESCRTRGLVPLGGTDWRGVDQG